MVRMFIDHSSMLYIILSWTFHTIDLIFGPVNKSTNFDRQITNQFISSPHTTELAFLFSVGDYRKPINWIDPT